MKKFLAIALSAVLMLSCLTGCGEKKPTPEERYAAFAQAVIKVAKQYNEAAQLAKDNGWEENFDTITLMNGIAEQINDLSAVVTNPENTEESKIVELTEKAEEIAKKLEEEILPKVQEAYQKAQ